jgi:hypothetical protein
MTRRKNETHEEYLARVREKAQKMTPEAREARNQRLADRYRERIAGMSEQELAEFRGTAVDRMRDWEKNLTPEEREDYNRRRSQATRARRFGLTLDQIEEMRRSQEGKCALCGEVPTPRKNGADGLNVDHRHDNGFVRGMLCAGCNRIVGVLDKDPDLLVRALAYARWGEDA